MPVEEQQNDIIHAVEGKSCEQKKLADRRNLLRLGAAGLPMVLTLKASARQAAISQLRCEFRLPARYRIMVDDTGAAWASTTLNVRFNNNRQAWRKDDLTAFLSAGDTVSFPAGSAPAAYRPASCNTPDQGNWVYCSWAKYSIGNNARIVPRNYINSNGDFEFNGSNKELFVALTIEYSDSRSSGWPGVSCIISILNYLDTV